MDGFPFAYPSQQTPLVVFLCMHIHPQFRKSLLHFGSCNWSEHNFFASADTRYPPAFLHIGVITHIGVMPAQPTRIRGWQCSQGCIGRAGSASLRSSQVFNLCSWWSSKSFGVTPAQQFELAAPSPTREIYIRAPTT